MTDENQETLTFDRTLQITICSLETCGHKQCFGYIMTFNEINSILPVYSHSSLHIYSPRLLFFILMSRLLENSPPATDSM